MEKEFKLLETEIDNLLSAAGLPLAGDMSAISQRRLPPKCPYCGGTVHPGEVEWINDTAAECDFCGSVIEEGS
jgi:NAD-dependent SIR2 family protein deacetylase